MGKTIGILLAILLVLGLMACQKAPEPTQAAPIAQDDKIVVPDPVPEGPLVGILLPDESWQVSGNWIAKELERKGYRIQLDYAGGDAAKQAQQMVDMILKEPACIVVTPVDSVALSQAGKAAKEAGVPVVAFDRLLMETDAVAGFVTFDYEAFGEEIAKYIIDAKQLDAAAEEHKVYTIEFFMGCTENHSDLLLHKGLMALLQPYLDTGVLECPSGRTSFADTYVLHADREIAKRKCLELLESSWQPDIICAASDVLAAGCAEAIREMGYEGDPVILLTGQSGDIEAVQRIVDGTQTMTIYKDWEALAIQCAQVVDTLVKGETPQWSDVKSFENHAVTVPAVVLPGVVVDKENYKEKLIDTKIYSTDALPTK